jgi:hypothetical protein
VINTRAERTIGESERTDIAAPAADSLWGELARYARPCSSSLQFVHVLAVVVAPASRTLDLALLEQHAIPGLYRWTCKSVEDSADSSLIQAALVHKTALNLIEFATIFSF